MNIFNIYEQLFSGIQTKTERQNLQVRGLIKTNKNKRLYCFQILKSWL